MDECVNVLIYLSCCDDTFLFFYLTFILQTICLWQSGKLPSKAIKCIIIYDGRKVTWAFDINNNTLNISSLENNNVNANLKYK